MFVGGDEGNAQLASGLATQFEPDVPSPLSITLEGSCEGCATRKSQVIAKIATILSGAC